MAAGIRVDGLKEFNRNLRKLDSDLPKALRLALNASADLIVSEAVPKIARRSGRAAGTVKARSTRTLARVQGGGSRAPYFPWLDFGGSVGRKNSVKRPFFKHGRYIYDAYFRNQDRFADVLQENLIDVARQAGLEVD